MSLIKLGIGNQSQAVLALLEGYAGIDPHYIQVAPWYNGRERGLCFYLDDYTKITPTRLCVAVFEHRNSDELCALKWEDQIDINPPANTSETRQRAYKGGNKHDIDFSVGWGEIGKMTMWVRAEFMQFVKGIAINETK